MSADDAFNAAITVRANAYAHRVATERNPEGFKAPSLISDAELATLIARAFVVGVAAGIEAERGPTDRRPSRRKR